MKVVGEGLVVVFGVALAVAVLGGLCMVLAWPVVDGWCELRDRWRRR
jgi:hypothetical protein